MTKNIRSVLSPLLIISYVSGLKMIELPTYYRRYLSLLYMLLFWSAYYFLLRYTVMFYLTNYTIIYRICLCVEIFTVLLSVVIGVHHNKKFRDCLKKLTNVDDTLQSLGITTNYHKLYMKMIWIILSWIITVILTTYMEVLWLQKEFDYGVTTAIYIVWMINYCSHLNFISNLFFTTVLGYIKLKFDQVNEFLWNLTRDKRLITTVWNSPMSHSHQRKFPKVLNNKWLTYILMHLHLELCKISREIDLIFGVEMTVSVGCYFFWLAQSFCEILNVILIKDYVKDKILYTILISSWFIHFVIKLLLINYICEKVCNKANATGDLINKISYSNCNVDHENISQFLLQIAQAPLKFCGLGLFQFGYKVFHHFSRYSATILVILVQMHVKK